MIIVPNIHSEDSSILFYHLRERCVAANSLTARQNTIVSVLPLISQGDHARTRWLIPDFIDSNRGVPKYAITRRRMRPMFASVAVAG